MFKEKLSVPEIKGTGIIIKGISMADIINIGILAHADAGKTTLTEQMLYMTGEVRAAGSVDSKNAQTDWLDIEHRRGISVRAASTRLFWHNRQINLIDTPGHVDFAGEVQRSLSVLDAAVLVISAVEGIQGQTEVLWEALRTLNLPTLIFINKIDRIGADVEAVVDDLRDRFSDDLVLLHHCTGTQTRSCTVTPIQLTDERIFDIAINTDAEAEECFLEERPISDEILLRALRAEIAAGHTFPVCMGAASLGVGIRELLDGIGLLPSASCDESAPVSGIVYKVEHDKTMGRAAHVRLFSGTLENRDPVPLCGREPMEKVVQIRRVLAHKTVDMGRLTAGDIGALYGLTNVYTGDIIGTPPRAGNITLATPLLKVRILPQKPEQLLELVAAVRELTVEDPLLDMEWEKEERELYIKITGMIQLEVIAAFLQDRFHLDVTFDSPSVIYKETPSVSGVGRADYTWPKPCWACVQLSVEPLPRGSGMVFESVVNDRVILSRYQAHIAQALPDALKQGLYGWEVTDLKLTLTGGSHHLIHTHPLDFFVATPMAVMDALEHTGVTLLEPMVTLRLSCAEECLGRIISDMISMRGTFDSPVIRDGRVTIEATVPVATSLEYPVKFSMLTGGRGIISSRFAGYAECPLELGKTTKRRGVDPRDHAKWILHARSVL